METKLRTLLRGIVYRLLAIIITAIITGINDAILIHVFLTVLYYIHERIWLKIRWGIK